MWSYMSDLLCALREKLDGLEPGGAAVARNVRAPAEGIGGDVAEDPAQVQPFRAGALLEDLAVFQPADQLGTETRARIDPGRAPGVELRVVDADRGAVLVVERSPALGLAEVRAVARRRDPDVLDRAVFERPVEADLPVVLAHRALGQKGLRFGFPPSDELAEEHQCGVHARSLRRGHLLRCQNLALSQCRGRHAERAPEARGEVAVARETEVEPDRGQIARRVEHLAQRGGKARAQVVAVQRQAGTLAEHARQVPGRAVDALRKLAQAPVLAGA